MDSIERLDPGESNQQFGIADTLRILPEIEDQQEAF